MVETAAIKAPAIYADRGHDPYQERLECVIPIRRKKNDFQFNDASSNELLCGLHLGDSCSNSTLEKHAGTKRVTRIAIQRPQFLNYHLEHVVGQVLEKPVERQR